MADEGPTEKKTLWLRFLSFLGMDPEKTKKQKTAEDISIQDALEREAYKKHINERGLHEEDPDDYETFKKKRAAEKIRNKG